jgi:hypothetical protein
MKLVTEHKNHDELPKELINDAEFVALIEQEMREGGEKLAEDELQKKRLWQRLEGSIGQPATPARSRTYWPWALAAALLLGLIPLFQNKEQDQYKGGESGPPKEAGILSLEAENGGLKASLSPATEAQSFVALFWASEPFEVLWQGPRPSGSWSVPTVSLRPGRICAITGRDESEITRKINLIRELKEVPDDAPCQAVQPTSE